MLSYDRYQIGGSIVHCVCVVVVVSVLIDSWRVVHEYDAIEVVWLYGKVSDP